METKSGGDVVTREQGSVTLGQPLHGWLEGMQEKIDSLPSMTLLLKLI